MGCKSTAVESLPPSTTAPATAVAVTSLAHAFRFHPTGEEFMNYLLKRKVLGKTVSLNAIGVVDIYKHEEDAKTILGHLIVSMVKKLLAQMQV
ncbi:hypothetical protein F2Q69_00009031 [Brassica cretica]|uniref:NAC domain-containing protein n=1 Tax=Brassica cretica TaxID=69181 RepID=A0A8S9NZM1_BRACR|nr:hypothetical protein F2Q69_00009031 [Brassica cretica]